MLRLILVKLFCYIWFHDQEDMPLTIAASFSFNIQLEKGVDGLFDSFSRLDSRISSVGQTAAKIGDHLQVKLV